MLVVQGLSSCVRAHIGDLIRLFMTWMRFFFLFSDIIMIDNLFSLRKGQKGKIFHRSESDFCVSQVRARSWLVHCEEASHILEFDWTSSFQLLLLTEIFSVYRGIVIFWWHFQKYCDIFVTCYVNRGVDISFSVTGCFFGLLGRSVWTFLGDKSFGLSVHRSDFVHLNIWPQVFHVFWAWHPLFLVWSCWLVRTPGCPELKFDFQSVDRHFLA